MVKETWLAPSDLLFCAGPQFELSRIWKVFIMRTIRLLLAGMMLAASVSPSFAFDRKMTQALKACHDYLWFQVPEFTDLPNAAISVFPGIWGDDQYVVFWNVYWDDPTLREAGNCQVKGDEVVGFEHYGRNT